MQLSRTRRVQAIRRGAFTVQRVRDLQILRVGKLGGAFSAALRDARVQSRRPARLQDTVWSAISFRCRRPPGHALKSTQVHHGWTPLHTAASFGHTEIVRASIGRH